MGLRAYFLVTLGDHMEQHKSIDMVRQLEEMPEVDFVDPVIGRRDMVIMVVAPVTVQATANKIRAREGIKDLEVLRVVSMLEHHHPSKREPVRVLVPSSV
ncbi:unnamed protein product [marine sediment metagenome]|uniref:Transcription regulator AsnC/Lrp ligand binding domain-containing protein n=1 Tax=marine sediment metagenome TaxID=412755 RepID=X1NPE3_9ZZZZ